MYHLDIDRPVLAIARYIPYGKELIGTQSLGMVVTDTSSVFMQCPPHTYLVYLLNTRLIQNNNNGSGRKKKFALGISLISKTFVL